MNHVTCCPHERKVTTSQLAHNSLTDPSCRPSSRLQLLVIETSNYCNRNQFGITNWCCRKCRMTHRTRERKGKHNCVDYKSLHEGSYDMLNANIHKAETLVIDLYFTRAFNCRLIDLLQIVIRMVILGIFGILERGSVKLHASPKSIAIIHPTFLSPLSVHFKASYNNLLLACCCSHHSRSTFIKSSQKWQRYWGWKPHRNY